MQVFVWKLKYGCGATEMLNKELLLLRLLLLLMLLLMLFLRQRQFDVVAAPSFDRTHWTTLH